MIVEGLLGGVLALLNAVLGLIPTYTMPVMGPGSDIGGAIALVGWGNKFFPVNDLFQAIGVILAVRLFLTIWNAAVYVYRLIPFKLT